MNAITLQPGDLVIAATLLVLDGALSVALGLGLHRAMLIASGMLVVGGVISWFGLQEAGRLSETHRLQKESGTA